MTISLGITLYNYNLNSWIDSQMYKWHCTLVIGTNTYTTWIIIFLDRKKRPNDLDEDTYKIKLCVINSNFLLTMRYEIIYEPRLVPVLYGSNLIFKKSELKLKQDTMTWSLHLQGWLMNSEFFFFISIQRWCTISSLAKMSIQGLHRSISISVPGW